MHQFNVFKKSTSNDSIKNDENQSSKLNDLQTITTASSSYPSMNSEKLPLSITTHSSIQHDRQELYHQSGSSSTDCAINAKKPPQHQTVTFSSEINLANQARCSVLQVLQAASSKSSTKTIKTTDLNRPHLQLNFAHSFRHPVSGSLDETTTGVTNQTNVGHLSTVHVVNRGSTYFSSKSPPSQHHHTILHQLPEQTSSFNQSNVYNQNVLLNQTNLYGTNTQTSKLTSPSYRAINLNLSATPTSGLSANDIYRGRRCFKRSISLASAQPHHQLNQQMSLTQPFPGGHHRRTLLADYGRRRAYLDSFE